LPYILINDTGALTANGPSLYTEIFVCRVRSSGVQSLTYGTYVTDNVKWPQKVLWGSTVGYHSDSLASCQYWF